MGRRHVIETASFELCLGAGADPERGAGALSEVVRTELMPVVERVFDEVAAGAEPIRLETVELDLGTLHVEGSWHEVKERLARQLAGALRRARSRGAAFPSDPDAAPPSGSGSRPPDDARASGSQGRAEPFVSPTPRAGEMSFGSASARHEEILAAAIDAAVPRDEREGDAELAPGEGERIRGYALYEALRARMTDRSPRGAEEAETSDVAGLVVTLLERHPQMLQRLYRELQSGTPPVAVVTGTLSGAELRALVRGFLALTVPEEARGAPSQLVLAIETFAARAASARRYFGEVLVRLARDELIDLEAIAAASGGSPDEKTVARATEGVAEPTEGSSTPAAEDGAARATEAADAMDTSRETPAQAPSRAATEPPPPRTVDDRTALTTDATKAADAVEAADTSGETLSRAPSEASTEPPPPRTANGGTAPAADVERTANAVDTSSETLPRAPSQPAPADEPSPSYVTDGQAHTAGTAAMARETLTAYLRDGTVADGGVGAPLRTLEAMLAQEPVLARRLLVEALGDERSVARLAERLPEPLLARVVRALAPEVHGELLDVADTLAIAALASGSGLPGSRLTDLKWQLVIEHALARDGTASPVLDEAAFVREFVAALARRSGPEERPALHTLLARQIVANALPETRATSRRILEALRTASAPAPTAGGEASALTVGDANAIRVADAGQVLASPYLPRLFERLALTERGAFHDREAAERAAALLRFMVDGSVEPTGQPSALARRLCGLSGPPAPDAPTVRLLPKERETVEELLRAMIEHWSVIGNTSVTGLRESFLRREGTLTTEADVWRLAVEPAPYDMLLDRLPWSVATIRHPWMARVLHVSWR